MRHQRVASKRIGDKSLNGTLLASMIISIEQGLAVIDLMYLPYIQRESRCGICSNVMMYLLLTKDKTLVKMHCASEPGLARSTMRIRSMAEDMAFLLCHHLIYINRCRVKI